MLDRIIHFSIANKAVILIISGLLLIWGTYTVIDTDVDIFPDLNAPTVVVMTEAPGFAPEEVEQQVTFPLETALNGATGVRRVRSSSATGFSVVWVEFDWDTDIYRARQTVSEKLSALSGSLPPGVASPTLGPQSSILGEVMIIGLTSDSLSMRDLRSIADRTIRPRLLSVGGVSQVAVIGGDIAECQILLSPEKMKHHGVTLTEVQEAVESINDNANGGILYEHGNEYIIKGDVRSSSIDDIARSVVKSTPEGAVLLSDVAEVAMGNKSPRLGLASERTHPAVLLTVTKQPGVSTIALTDRLVRELDDISSRLPSDIHVSTDIFRQADFIGRSIGNLQVSLFEGALFVIVVLFFFLMNLRTTLISLVALPVSIIITVLIMHLLGLTVNTMSLGGIAIAIGSLVDDAIVDVENVYKRLKANHAMPPADRQPVATVVYQASSEVRLPILNSSLIIVASFLPLFFLSGIEGRMLIPLGVSFIIALAASTVVALTLTPVLCVYLLGSPRAAMTMQREPWAMRRLRSLYSGLLERSLRHGRAILIASAALLCLAAVLFFTLGRSFLPSFNEGSLTINVSTLPGVSLEESDRIGREAEKIILSVPEIRTVARKTGRAELDEHALGANVSEIEAPYTLSGRSRAEMMRDLRGRLSALPGTNIEIGQPISHRIDAMLSGTEAQIAIKVFGDDLTRLYKAGNDIRRAISGLPGIVDVNVEQQTERPQIDIRPRRDLMARYGITNARFIDYVNTMLGGVVVSQIFDSGLPYDITLKAGDGSRSSIESISDMMIDTDMGPVPLSHIADIVSSSGPNTINREGVSRRLVVSANVDGSDLRGAVDLIRRTVDTKVVLPEGYHVTYGGQFESEAAASRTLWLASLGAVALIFLLLYREFRSAAQSAVILVNMPLAMIGGVLILAVTSSELNIPAIIGFISLIGISTRNGMLLMSRFNRLKAQGVPLMERIARGATDRLNPIVMTALSSALALVPLALRSQEAGNEIQSPMAMVILGGLVSSTILNVFVVPILYRLIETRRNTDK